MDAKALTHKLDGKWRGSYGSAPCPVCQPESRKGQNALTLADGREGRLLANCKKSACTFSDILAAAGVTPGSFSPPGAATIGRRKAERRAQAEKRARQARQCWDETLPIGGTVAESYLRARGISCELPSTLRFHPECWHGPAARRYPALVALVEGGDSFAIHRAYLAPDGRRKATVTPDKMMLGSTQGNAARLTQAQGPLVVAEGIETALSLASGLLGCPATIWAALSTSGLRGLRLPTQPEQLIIATDGDEPGRAAGHDLAERAHGMGWAVSLLPAPDGRDWNDVLAGKAVAA